MIRILLIRHGHTALLGKVLYGRMPGVHLSEQGKEEVQRLAVGLQTHYQVDEIISSPLQRAKETADAISAVGKQPVVYDPDIQEIDYGEWMGREFSDLLDDDEWKRYSRLRSLSRAPGGEFLMHVQLRAWTAIERAIDRHNDRDLTLAVVTHGDVVRALLLLFLGMPADHIHRIEASTGSVTEVLLGGAYPQVVKVNQTF